MSRSIWNGTIAFGLIRVPVKVHSATEDQTVHFHQVHVVDGARIKQRRLCSKEEREVPYAEVAKGYEVSEGEYVLLSPEEIKAAAGEASHRIDIEQFAQAQEIDPDFYERSYYLEAAGEGARAPYRLLHDAMARCERVGIGRWVFHNREYLVAIRALDGVIALHTMRFADELVDADDLELAEPSRAPSAREVEMAGALVDSLHGEFDPTAFKDEYRQRVLALIKRKAAGEEIEIEPAPDVQSAPDLMAALEASLAARSGGKGGGKGDAAKDKSSSSRAKSTSKSKSSSSRTKSTSNTKSASQAKKAKS